jgi:CheY-like chemotaxis protein
MKETRMRIVVVNDHPVLTDRTRTVLESMGACLDEQHPGVGEVPIQEAEPGLFLLDIDRACERNVCDRTDILESAISLHRVPTVFLTRLIAGHRRKAIGSSSDLRFLPRPIPLSLLVQWLAHTDPGTAHAA